MRINSTPKIYKFNSLKAVSGLVVGSSAGFQVTHPNHHSNRAESAPGM